MENETYERIMKIVRRVLLILLAVFLLVRTVSCAVTWTSAGFENGRLVVGGHAYIKRGFTCTGTKRQIAYFDGWSVHQVNEDPSRTFITLRSFLDGYEYVREDYEIPSEGEITVFYIGNIRFTDPHFIGMLEELSAVLPEESFTVWYDDYLPTKDIRVGYEGCPVGTHSGGDFALINGKFVFLTDCTRKYTEGVSFEGREYVCYVLPDRHAKILEPYRKLFTERTIPES